MWSRASLAKTVPRWLRLPGGCHLAFFIVDLPIKWFKENRPGELFWPYRVSRETAVQARSGRCNGCRQHPEIHHSALIENDSENGPFLGFFGLPAISGTPIIF
jgi:hypothetical protein